VALTIVAAVLVIGVVIYIHELGHFLAAKLSGVRVEIFSMGLGPKLWGVTVGETEYAISAIPFGGYVKMEGDIPSDLEGGETSTPPEETEAETGHGQESGFLAKSKGVRALIVAAGPAMNFLMAIALFAALTALLGIPVLTTTEVGWVEDGTPAMEAGLEAGDLIRSVGGIVINDWDHLEEILEGSLGQETSVTVERGGREVVLTLRLASVTALDGVGAEPYLPPSVGGVVRDSPADEVGLKAGDRITRVGGRAIHSWQDLVHIIRPSAGKRLDIEWERDGEILTSTVTPRETQGRGMLGINSDYSELVGARPAGPLEALRQGVKNAAWVSVQIFNILRLLRQGVPVREVIGGPVRIGQLAGQSLRRGPETFITFIAAISAQLALLNLLPIPVLDGGHLLLLSVEAIARKPVTARQRIIAQQVGLFLLIALMLFVTMIDVSRLLSG
jgi:regulator of sigma E protease